MGAKIDSAVAWAVAIANDNSHGYDQEDRWGPDYDCSSLVCKAYDQAGIDVIGCGATNTRTMYNGFIKAGFKDVTSKVNVETGANSIKGDVFLTPGNHTAMVIDSDTHWFVEAHYNENYEATGGQTGDQLGKEIATNAWHKLKTAAWKYVLRYPEDPEPVEDPVDKSDVINSNTYLSLAQMKNNAIYIANWLHKRGWTFEAIAGVLGNMQTESNMNPGIWESLDEGNTTRGFGLVQWTPATKLIEWADKNGLDYTDIDTQLLRIIYELENGLQFYATEAYPISFKTFVTSTETPEYLAAAFLYNYERPASPNATLRGEQARYWYEIITDSAIVYPPADSEDPEIPNVTTPKHKKLSLILMYAATRR